MLYRYCKSLAGVSVPACSKSLAGAWRVPITYTYIPLLFRTSTWYLVSIPQKKKNNRQKEGLKMFA